MPLGTTIIGYIEEPYVKDNRHDLAMKNHNRAKLMMLPVRDPWPPLTRGFFNITGPEETYAQTLIYFCGTYKEFETFWAGWLEKFESLLKSLFWQEVKLYYTGSYSGKFTYSWIADEAIIQSYREGGLDRVSKWKFYGGPREFQ